MSNRKFLDPTKFKTEIVNFLKERGFKELELDDTHERVFGKRVNKKDTYPRCLRVYTTIDKRTGTVRGVGTDAIRVELFYRERDGSVHMCGHGRRVNRIKTWKKNLSSRIRNWEWTIAGISCNFCGRPMIMRESKFGPFWGCCGYPKCKNTVDIST